MFRKIVFIGLFLIFACTEVFAGCCSGQNCGMECSQVAQKYKIYMNRIQNERAVVSNALNLTDEQIKKREEMICKNNPLYEKKFEEFLRESYKIKALKCACASECEILQQKRIVNKIKKDINCLVNEENKAFKKCLTRDQRAKFSMIKRLERKEIKTASHQKDYYKSNPQMRYFGNPLNSPCANTCKSH